MEEFKKTQNLNKLILGSTKMSKEKLNFNIDKQIINETVENEWKNTINLYTNNNYDIKTLNNYCLTLIKNKLTKINIENFEKHQNDNNNVNNIVNDELNNNKLDSDFLELKVKELEETRNYLPDYDNNNIQNIELSNEPKNSNKIPKDNNITTINYNNINNNTNIYKSIIIKSSSNLNIKKLLNIDYKQYKFFPEELYLPHYINEITPFIKLKFFDNTNEIIYNFRSIINNKKWNTWKTIDSFNIDLDLNNSLIELYDYNNKLLKFNNNIKINKVLQIKNNNLIFYKLWCEKDFIYNYNNNYEINDEILIKNNNGFNFSKKIINIHNSEPQYNIITIYDDNNNFTVDNFNNSTFILLKNDFSLLIKYYIK